MLLNLSTILLFTLTVSAAPVKRQKGVEWDYPGVNIIPGLPGSPIIVGGDCPDRETLCHELCHVYQQNLTNLSQCYDDCAKETDPADGCERQAGTGYNRPGPSTGGSGPSTSAGSG